MLFFFFGIKKNLLVLSTRLRRGFFSVSNSFTFNYGVNLWWYIGDGTHFKKVDLRPLLCLVDLKSMSRPPLRFITSMNLSC